jgi:hypothetical protein
MRTLCTIVLLVAVGLGVLGYVRGWYTVVTSDERIDISIDRKKVEADSEEWRNKAKQTVDEYRQPGGDPAADPANPAQPGNSQPGQGAPQPAPQPRPKAPQ